MARSTTLGKKPVVIGVSGHRDFGDKTKALEATVRAECLGLAQDRNLTDFIVLSPLAEGADRIVARVAMDVLKARLIVPLPLPVATYVQDFPETRGEFDALLARADDVIEGPLLSAGTAWQDYGEPRNLQYAWVGDYVVRHCHVLFALWDGKPARGTGGTAEVVKWFRESIRGGTPPSSPPSVPPQVGSLPLAESRLLIHITPETGQVERTGKL